MSHDPTDPTDPARPAGADAPTTPAGPSGPTDAAGPGEPGRSGDVPSDGEPPSDAGEGATDEESDGPRRGVITSVVREIGIVLALSLIIATVIRIFVVQAFLIPSGSMENTLLEGDRVAVSKFTTVFGDVERGDVVVFEDPGGWLSGTEVAVGPQSGPGAAFRGVLEFVGVLPNDAQGHLIKRVVGVGGDRVECCTDGELTVNGQVVDESSFLYPGDVASLEDFDVTVPEGEMFVMGDHRSNSRDSRVNGTVPTDLVTGRAVAVIWPFDRWAGLPSAEEFDSVPELPAAPDDR